MKHKKLNQEQKNLVQRARDKHTMFSFDMVRPFYYIKENIFKDPKKGMYTYFDEQESKLVYILESKEEKMTSIKIDEWVEKYHKDKINITKEREAKREANRIEREKRRKKNKLKIEKSSKELKKTKTTTTKDKKTPGTKKKASTTTKQNKTENTK